MNKKFTFLSLIILFSQIVVAQNLEEFGIKKGIKPSGGINFGAVSYLANGISARRDPFAFYVSGNININFFGYNTPFTFSYSNTNRTFTQPFNQFSFSPSYKWIKTYIGYNSMSFSQYTLAGYNFLGGGVELSPKKWRFAAMYGRLRKAVPFNLADSSQNYNASYKRMGQGIKLGYNDGKNMIGISLFHAKDVINSLPYIIFNTGLTPKENLVTGINAKKRISDRIFVEGEYAYSVLTNNITYKEKHDSLSIDSLPHNEKNYFLKGIIQSNATTRHYDAYNFSVGYQGIWYGVQLKYERISPDYQTLGAYYFNSDLKNITVIPTFRVFNNKLIINANLGWQNNNLDHLKASTTKRFVSAYNINFAPNERWNFGGNYSNFTTFTNIRPQTDPFFRNTLDTLNFYQVNNTLNAVTSYNFGLAEHRQSIFLNVSYQKASDKASYKAGNNMVSDFYTGNISYSYSIAPQNLSLALSVNYYTNHLSTTQSSYYGPNVSITKAFLNKTLRATYSGSFNKNVVNKQSSSSILNNRFGLNYSPKTDPKNKFGRHNLGLSINILKRFQGKFDSPNSNNTSFLEATTNFNYSYSF